MSKQIYNIVLPTTEYIFGYPLTENHVFIAD